MELDWWWEDLHSAQRYRNARTRRLERQNRIFDVVVGVGVDEGVGFGVTGVDAAGVGVVDIWPGSKRTIGRASMAWVFVLSRWSRKWEV